MKGEDEMELGILEDPPFYSLLVNYSPFRAQCSPSEMKL